MRRNSKESAVQMQLLDVAVTNNYTQLVQIIFLFALHVVVGGGSSGYH